MPTARFFIPQLQSGQAQKEVTHNEAVQALENLIQPIVDEGPRNDPPAEPVEGRQYLVGPEPTGMFSAHANNLATWTSAGWLFSAVPENFMTVDRVTHMPWTLEGGRWRAGLLRGTEVQVNGRRVIGAQQPPITGPSGGGNVDQEARNAIAGILAALRAHGLVAEVPGTSA